MRRLVVFPARRDWRAKALPFARPPPPKKAPPPPVGGGHARSYTGPMSSRAAFVVPVHDLDVTGRSVEFKLTDAWLRGALEGCEIQPAPAGGVLTAHLAKTGTDILVQGQIDVELVVPCARCLKEVGLHPHIELSLLLRPAESPGPDAFGARHAPPGPGRRAPAKGK